MVTKHECYKEAEISILQTSIKYMTENAERQEKKTDEISVKLDQIQASLSYMREYVDSKAVDCLQNVKKEVSLYVTKEEFSTVRAIVYGCVVMILLTFIGLALMKVTGHAVNIG